MTIVHDDGGVTVWHGDCLDVLRELPDASVDAIVTDPPYGLEFMGKDWDSFRPDLLANRGGAAPGRAAFREDRLAPVDYGTVKRRTTLTCSVCGKRDKFANDHGCDGATWERIYLDTSAANVAFMRAYGAWCEAWAVECLRVLKPGGHLLAFGGTRTWHRLTCAVEDAGFEIRDTITWLYGSGFPKSLNVGRAVDLALQPGVAPEEAVPTPQGDTWRGHGTALKPASEPIVVARRPLTGTVAANVLAHGTGALNIDGCRVGTGEDRASGGRGINRQGDPSWRFSDKSERPTGGRWPANVVLTHGDCGDECVPGCPVADLDAQSGTLTSGANPTRRGVDGERNAYGAFNGQEQATAYRGQESGGASRFFPRFRYQAKADAAERPRAGLTAHPTVKPLDLIRWLVRLVTPPGGLILDPFAGSGTTGEAARLEHARAVLIECDTDYLPLIVDRLTRRTDPVAHLTAKARRGETVDLGLFADLDLEGA